MKLKIKKITEVNLIQPLELVTRIMRIELKK
jgi:hypothetical protein